MPSKTADEIRTELAARMSVEPSALEHISTAMGDSGPGQFTFTCETDPYTLDRSTAYVVECHADGSRRYFRETETWNDCRVSVTREELVAPIPVPTYGYVLRLYRTFPVRSAHGIAIERELISEEWTPSMDRASRVANRRAWEMNGQRVPGSSSGWSGNSRTHSADPSAPNFDRSAEWFLHFSTASQDLFHGYRFGWSPVLPADADSPLHGPADLRSSARDSSLSVGERIAQLTHFRAARATLSSDYTIRAVGHNLTLSGWSWIELLEDHLRTDTGLADRVLSMLESGPDRVSS